MNHHVHHAMFLQVFSTLKTLWKLFADGLLDHASARKTDQRAGLRDLNIAQHRVGRRHAASRRIGQHSRRYL